MKRFSLIFLVLIISHASARLLPADRDSTPTETKPIEKITAVDDLSTLMGVDLERCGDGDEECEKRRMNSEVHLDYIYTQQHQP